MGVACDTCGRRAYLFQLSGRKDSNCAECCADIATLVLLYERLRIAECHGENAPDLQAKLVSLMTVFARLWLAAAPRRSLGDGLKL